MVNKQQKYRPRIATTRRPSIAPLSTSALPSSNAPAAVPAAAYRKVQKPVASATKPKASVDFVETLRTSGVATTASEVPAPSRATRCGARGGYQSAAGRRNNYNDGTARPNRWSHSDQNAGQTITVTIEEPGPAYTCAPEYMNWSVYPWLHGQCFGFPPWHYWPIYFHQGSDLFFDPAVDNEEIRFPCRNYNHQGCNHGKGCFNRHAPDDKSEQDIDGKNVCVYYLLDRCTKAECAYSHDDSRLPLGWWSTKKSVKEAQAIFDQSLLDPKTLALQLKAQLGWLQTHRDVDVAAGNCLSIKGLTVANTTRRPVLRETTRHCNRQAEPQNPKDTVSVGKPPAPESASKDPINLGKADSSIKACVKNNLHTPSQPEDNLRSLVAEGHNALSRASSPTRTEELSRLEVEALPAEPIVDLSEETIKLGADTSHGPESLGETQSIA